MKKCFKVNKSQCISINFKKKKQSSHTVTNEGAVCYYDWHTYTHQKHGVHCAYQTHENIRNAQIHMPYILCACYFWYFTFRIRILMMKKEALTKKNQQLSIRSQKNTYIIKIMDKQQRQMLSLRACTHKLSCSSSYSRSYVYFVYDGWCRFIYIFLRSKVLWCTYA